MICPFCQANLVKLKKPKYGIGYECRKYFYLEKDYPVCHYTYREYSDRHYVVEHRYLFYPFVIYAKPELNICQIEYLYKKEGATHHSMLDLVDLEYFVPDCSKPELLLNKFNTYLIFK